MGYYSATKKKEVLLPFASTWTDSKDIMLSETSQRNTNTVSSYLCVESNENNKNTRGKGWRSWEKRKKGSKAQTSSY